jgi:hypothetical protein
MHTMDRAKDSLLRSGAGAAWAVIEAQQRQALTRPAHTIEQRLGRGQRLSAQAAALRRSVRDGARRDA